MKKISKDTLAVTCIIQYNDITEQVELKTDTSDLVGEEPIFMADSIMRTAAQQVAERFKNTAFRKLYPQPTPPYIGDDNAN